VKVSPLVAAMAERRRELGWSQLTLAIEVGTSQSQICLYEHGKVAPMPSTLTRLADALDCDLVLVPRDPGRERHV
jgi:transcriptional regulator with XRE-family HTH domain